MPLPVPSLIKDGESADARLLSLDSCHKIFIPRDYSTGLNVKFDTTYPSKFSGTGITEEIWTNTITTINKIFEEAESVGWSSFFETIIGCATCYISRIFSSTLYEKKISELVEFIERQNRDIYKPSDVYIVSPMERGLRVIEISLLGTTTNEPLDRVDNARGNTA
ncbi:unnamed protein product [Auanema sp. JU1783]|nr:unnamed protein product [Auanema sp. JU1783]